MRSTQLANGCRVLSLQRSKLGGKSCFELGICLCQRTRVLVVQLLHSPGMLGVSRSNHIVVRRLEGLGLCSCPRCSFRNRTVVLLRQLIDARLKGLLCLLVGSLGSCSRCSVLLLETLDSSGVLQNQCARVTLRGMHLERVFFAHALKCCSMVRSCIRGGSLVACRRSRAIVGVLRDKGSHLLTGSRCFSIKGGLGCGELVPLCSVGGLERGHLRSMIALSLCERVVVGSLQHRKGRRRLLLLSCRRRVQLGLPLGDESLRCSSVLLRQRGETGFKRCCLALLRSL